ncbi:response regulator transcription factor [Leucobacter chromiireducens]|uniref:DNA-binding response regulator n=1 Tax=Leucobacter chromiireducens subsp. solipictus TaxID=398235 RepID=A0ABS1SBI1_9MICO|nr:response regulator transcription factor [Leucobacter chromiireducens]MBL3677899.1 DNA-binding response regulator [Leucobacter chromiireducens subsp. solipictus]
MTDTVSEKIRVVVVDDQALVRAGNALILDSDDGIEVIGEAGSGADALALVAADPPDVVLMDVRMPGMDGITATRHLIERHPDTRVIVLTTFALDAYAFESLRAGASAFLLKSSTPAALVHAVRTVAAGTAIAAPDLAAGLIAHTVGGAGAGAGAAAGTGRVAGHGTGAPGEAGLAALSPRERDVFLAVVRGLSNAEISTELFLAPATVKSHINAIFAKLDLRDRVHAVILGYQLGFGESPR